MQIGTIMVVRITKTNSNARTVLRVDGLLQAADVDALHGEYQTAEGAVTLELSELRSADLRGVEAIHELVSHGATLCGLSPYIELLLSTSRMTTLRCGDDGNGRVDTETSLKLLGPTLGREDNTDV